MRKDFGLAAICLFVASALLAGSAGANTLISPVTTRMSTSSVHTYGLRRDFAATDKIIVFRGINDHPRNPNSPYFQARRIAAHKRGLWLTDELNAGIGGGYISTPNSHSATPNVCIYGQPNCGHPTPTPKPTYPPHYGYGTFGTTTVRTQSLVTCDTEVDYTDGTSDCEGDYSDNGGNDYLVAFDPSGQEVALVENNNSTPPPPSCDNDSDCYTGDWAENPNPCEIASGGVVICPDWGPLFHNVWFCRWLAASGGLAAKWGGSFLVRGKFKPATDWLGLTVAAGLATACGK